MSITKTNPTAFDAFAADYDSDFTHTPLGHLLRPRVWQTFAQHFKLGQHVLELTCGTGEDAVWLAQRGVRVTATDGSAAMVAEAQAKAEAAGVSARVAVEQLSLQDIIDGWREASYPGTRSVPSALQRRASERGEPIESALQRGASERGENLPDSWQCSALPRKPGRSASPLAQPFDGVYSNFGGLNTINDWAGLAEALAALIRPGGKAILVPMGSLCPWEIGWYLLHGQPKTAVRRFARDGAPAKIGEVVIPIWYPSARRLRTDFAPWFRHGHTESLGLWLPPSYLDHFVNRWPTLFAALNRFEQATARLTRGWGDHYVMVLERL